MTNAKENTPSGIDPIHMSEDIKSLLVLIGESMSAMSSREEDIVLENIACIFQRHEPPFDCLPLIAQIEGVSSKTLGGLLSFGADIKATDLQGNTVFHHLAMANNCEMIRALIIHYSILLKEQEYNYYQIQNTIKLTLNQQNEAGETILDLLITSYDLNNITNYSLVGMRELLISGADEKNAIDSVVRHSEILGDLAREVADEEVIIAINIFKSHALELIEQHRRLSPKPKLSIELLPADLKIAKFIKEADDYKRIFHSLKCSIKKPASLETANILLPLVISKFTHKNKILKKNKVTVAAAEKLDSVNDQPEKLRKLYIVSG